MCVAARPEDLLQIAQEERLILYCLCIVRSTKWKVSRLVRSALALAAREYSVAED